MVIFYKPHDVVYRFTKKLLGKIDKRIEQKKMKKIEEVHKKIWISSLFFGDFSLK